jgi:hypothetical protein
MSYPETHPYNSEPLSDNVRLLIVGTAPPPRFSNPRCKGKEAHKLDFDFFYGSGHNNMWFWLNQIAACQGTPLPNDEAKSEEYGKAARDYLRRNRLWMKDVLQTYRRKPGCECNSGDDDIVKPLRSECVNFAEVIVQHPLIAALAFTSYKAAEWSFMAMGQPDHSRVDRDLTAGLTKPFHRMRISGREIRFFLLPSPSNRAVPSLEAVDIYKAVLFDRS